jgi:hypothetical protein
MKKKEFLTEAKRKAIIADKEKAILESFAKTFNKIKRIDENEINRIDENELPSFAQGISQKYKLRLVNGDGVQLGKMYKESKGDFGGDFEGVMSYNPSISVVVVLSKNEKTGEEVFNEFKKFNANDVGYESFGLTVDGYKFPLDNQPTTEEKAFIKSFKINPQL